MLPITAKVTAGARTEKIEEITPGNFKIRVQTAPENGKANKRVIEMLAEYYKIPVSRVVLTAGATFREKRFLIDK